MLGSVRSWKESLFRPVSFAVGGKGEAVVETIVALLPELQKKPLGSRAEQRDRSAMNGEKWTTLQSVVTKLPTHILIATVCIPDSASFSSLIVDPYTEAAGVGSAGETILFWCSHEGRSAAAHAIDHAAS